jgi:hypothetical protein
VIGLDLTIRKGDGTEIDEGMTERFIKIVRHFCDRRLLESEKLMEITAQIDKAAPLTDLEARKEREDAVNKLTSGFFNRDEKITQQAIDTFKRFVQDMKQRSMNEKGYLTDNQYYIGLIHLMSKCLEKLLDCYGDNYRHTAKLFCSDIIGEFLLLQQWIPNRVKQIVGLEPPVITPSYERRAYKGDNSFGALIFGGFNSLFYDDKKPDRTIFDISGDHLRASIAGNRDASHYNTGAGNHPCYDHFKNKFQCDNLLNLIYSSYSSLDWIDSNCNSAHIKLTLEDDLDTIFEKIHARKTP